MSQVRGIHSDDTGIAIGTITSYMAFILWGVVPWVMQGWPDPWLYLTIVSCVGTSIGWAVRVARRQSEVRRLRQHYESSGHD